MVSIVLAAPKTYTVLKMPAGESPTIDGFLTEWPEAYFIDTLDSENNVYARDAGTSEWTTEEVNFKVYATYDDSMFYFAIKYFRDDDIVASGSNVYHMDNIKINPGGEAMAFYVGATTLVVLNPSSPYIPNVNLWLGCKTLGNDPFATYEFAIKKDMIDPYSMGVYQFSLGVEEYDTNGQSYFAAIGAEYTGFKQDWTSNPWDNSLYYPTFTMGSEGPALDAVEDGAVAAKGVAAVSAAPNPFNPTTTISYTAEKAGMLNIFDANGQMVKSFSTIAGTNSVNWNASNMASGVYVARLISGSSVFNTKLFLTK
jgi:hypothetical protein